MNVCVKVCVCVCICVCVCVCVCVCMCEGGGELLLHGSKQRAAKRLLRFTRAIPTGSAAFFFLFFFLSSILPSSPPTPHPRMDAKHWLFIIPLKEKATAAWHDCWDQMKSVERGSIAWLCVAACSNVKWTFCLPLPLINRTTLSSVQ